MDEIMTHTGVAISRHLKCYLFQIIVTRFYLLLNYYSNWSNSFFVFIKCFQADLIIVGLLLFL